VTSEFARIARIEALFRRESSDVLLGIGDDCALLAPSVYPRAWTIDAAVAEVHFSQVYMSLPDIGYRAFMAAASDVAAMGGRAVAALSALILPTDLTDAALTLLIGGIAEAADACSCPIIGGNLARGGELSLTTSVLGECPGNVLTRAGAQVGDGVFVTGPLGGAALGLRVLQRGLATPCEAAIAAFLRPRARLDCALALAEVASAAIDLSDGLAQDLRHLCRMSNVGARIDARAIPRLPMFDDAAHALGHRVEALMITGGEDYELLFTAPPANVPPSLGTRIGTVTASLDVLIVDQQGEPLSLTDGFDHFLVRD
jgi:thiamine-monophosphate kinase